MSGLILAEENRLQINYMENHVAIGAKWAESPGWGLLLHGFECNKLRNQLRGGAEDGGGRRTAPTGGRRRREDAANGRATATGGRRQREERRAELTRRATRPEDATLIPRVTNRAARRVRQSSRGGRLGLPRGT